MKFRTACGVCSLLCLGVTTLQSQETDQAKQIQQMQQQLRQLQETFEQSEQQHRLQLEKLRRQIDALEQSQARPAPDLLQAGPEPAPPSSPTLPAAVEKRGWSPADPIQIGSGRAYMNIGLVATFAAGGSTANNIEGGTQLGGHDSNQRGFTVQGVEANFEGAVDPYFRGNANLAFLLNSAGDSAVELEEAWLETISLPANLQVRAGQYLTEFGRINTQHPHSWSFVDVPLVNGRFLGPDGLRNPGARVSWLVPTPFYSELFLGIQNSHGGTASGFRGGGGHHHGEDDGLPLAYRHADNDRGVRGLDDLLFSPRYALSFDVTDNQVLLLGSSAAFGPNSSGGEYSGDTFTQIYGLDLTWKWKSPRHQAGFPFVLWQSEAMLRRFEAGSFDWQEVKDAGGTPIVDVDTSLPAVLPGETLIDYGFYTQLLCGFRKGWLAGLRFDYLTGSQADYEKMNLALNGVPLGRDPQRAQRWRVSPNLTWYPSEFSMLRLQYNYDDRKNIGVDHSVWLQFEFSLGAHAAHKF